MALSGRELLLIVRAQNQASQALRRVAGDMQRLGGIRDLHFRQNQLAINQSNIMRQRQRALNELQSIENAQGFRALSLDRRRAANRASQIQAEQQLARAQKSRMRLVRAGVKGDTLKAATRDVEKYRERLNAAQIGAQQLAAAEGVAAQRASVLRSEIATANQRLAQNAFQQREIAKAIRTQRWEKLRTGASIATHFGRVMQLAGLVGGAAVATLAHSAAQFNTQATLVATQTGPIGSGFAKIGKNAKFLEVALLGVMRQGTATRDELTQAAYDIYSSLTIPGNNMRQLRTGVDILRQFNMAAIAGAAPVNDVASAVIAVLGAFKEIQPTGQNVHKLLQRMFAAVRFGRFSFADLTKTLATSAPAARAAGQSFNTLMGSLAFLSRPLGINRASIGFARLTEILSRQKMVKGLKDLGVNITDTNGHLLQMPEIIGRITRKFPELTKGGVALSQFFKKVSGTEGTIQARRAFVFLAQQLDRYRKVLGQTTSDNNEFSRSFAAMGKTSGVQWQIFLNNLKAFAIELGQAVLPALVKLTRPLQHLATWFENLDKSQKDTIGRYATYVAAFLLLGGTIISVGGMILGFISILGKLGIAGAGISVMLFAVIAAVKVLNGEWRSLSDVADSFANTMTGSFKGFVAMSALVVAAILRIRKAFVGLSIATAVGGGAGAAGGLRGMLGGIGAAFAAGRLAASTRAAAGASKLAAGLGGAAATAAALPGPLKLAAVAIGLAAGGALLWKHHMQGVEDHAERIARFQRITQRVGAGPVAPTRIFGRLGMDVRDILEQRNAVAGLNAQIRENEKAQRSANAAERPALRREHVDLVLERARAVDTLRQANSNAAGSFNAFTDLIGKQARSLDLLGKTQILLTRERGKLKDVLGAMGTLGGPGTQRGQDQIRHLREGIQNLKERIATLGPQAARTGDVIGRTFARVTRDLSTAKIIPRVSPTALRSMLNLAIKRQRMLTIPEMKMVIRAVADPASLRKLPRDVQAAVRTAKVAIRVEAQQTKARKEFPAFAKSIGKFIPAVQIITKANKQSANAAKTGIGAIFKKTINQPIHVGPVSPAAVAVGADIASGIRSGFGSVNLSVAINAHINKTITAVRKELGSHSPSRKTAKLIGVPMVEGIIQGILSKIPELERSSRLAVDFFNGPWLTSSKFTEAKKKVHIHVRDLIKDLRMQVSQFRQFNNALARLAARGVPLQLLDQLSQLGTEGAKKIAMLANASQRQLNRYVRLWRKAQREIARSERTNFDQIITNLHDFVEQAAHTLLDKFNEIKDGLTSSWMDISNISEWGARQYAMSADRILRNAQRQLENMLTAGDLVDKLRTRGLPAELLAQLAQMGPQALPMLAGLNNMTDAQLQQFIDIWIKMQQNIDKQTKKLMDDQIKMWKKHGADIAAGIIAGVMSEQEQLLKFFRKLFLNLLKEARKETKAHSPSKVFEDLGKDIVVGLALGLSKGNSMRVPMPKMAGYTGAQGRHGSQPPIQMTVHAHHNESLMTTLERAAFRLRNRRV